MSEGPSYWINPSGSLGCDVGDKARRRQHKALLKLEEIMNEGSEIERLRAERDEARRERDELRAKIAGLEESTHYANGCADLAMKHRDIAESELAALRARIDGAPVARVGLQGWLHSQQEGMFGTRVALVPLDD